MVAYTGFTLCRTLDWSAWPVSQLRVLCKLLSLWQCLAPLPVVRSVKVQEGCLTTLHLILHGYLRP